MIESPRPKDVTSLLTPGSMWHQLDWVASTGSTNKDLASEARDGATQGRVLLASEQTQGRGRLDRSWVSPAGKSLAISVILEPTPDFSRWGWLSLLAGLAVHEAVAKHAPHLTGLELKWPNDVLISGKKICGILSERVEHAAGPRAIVGIGLNLTLQHFELPTTSATSLSLQGIDVEASRLAADILNAFERHYQAWQAQGSLRETYEARCASVGAQLEIVLGPGDSVRGTGAGVDDLGHLRVTTAAGERTFVVGDVIHATMSR